jgi:peptide/nickel transport system permease protein
MSVIIQEKVKPPFYYVKKRFLNNKPAVVGLAIILLCVVITLLGNLIMPDHTPNVNDSAVQIKKKPLGYSVTMLRTRKNMDIPQVNFLEHIYVGQESSFTITPIDRTVWMGWMPM